MLQDIFEEVEKRVKNAKEGSMLDFYRTSLLRLGKAHRVETLMQGILRGLDALATNRLFKTATQSQMAELKKAIDQLSNVKSSVPDSDLEGSVAQNIASGGTGNQSIISGQDHKINSGSGKQFIANTMTFDQERDELAQALRKLYNTENNTKNNINLKFLVTSRPYNKIGRAFQPLNIPGLPIIHLKGEGEAEISKIAQEIDVYIEDRVSRIRASLCLKPDEEQLLLQKLRDIPHQTDLWVYLTLELIENNIGIDKTKIREATSVLPRTIDNAYERILAKSSNPKEAKKLLHIVVAVARPLTLAEMDLALALRQKHRSYKDLDGRPEERFGRYVRDLCGLFITITDSKIYLLHQTAKEFLVPKGDPDPREDHNNQLIWKSSLKPRDSHCILC
ncbi:hypothetical protein QQZ08_011010 [Neonectria magnoliae]|uniref:Uncharacterized protein n=1 Tax=Neonectria magnoliae TaxID=2732573 RepID=A0ABR1HDT8_9HYPO